MIAKHDGTEVFSLDRTIGGRTACYLAVPGGAVLLALGTSVFIPMCRVEYDLPENASVPAQMPINVHLTSTLPQLMMAGAIAGLQAAGVPIDGLDKGGSG